MYKVNDYVMYRKDVCKVTEIKEKAFQDNDYYVLASVQDESLTMQVPVKNDKIRPLITKKEVEVFIKAIPGLEIIEVDNDKMLEAEYKVLLNSGKQEDLIRIIKTTYLRNQKRIDEKKKVGSIDQNYFELAENCLYQEIGIVLGMNIEDTKEYIHNVIEQN